MSQLNLASHEALRISPQQAMALRPLVEQFNIEYCATLDSGDIENWPNYFTDDCIYRITARENAHLNMPVGLVYADNKAMLHDRAVAIARTQMFAPRTMLHILSNTRIIDARDEEIIASCNFLLLQTLVEGPSTVHLAGTYYDRFEHKGEQELLLKERQVVYESSVIANDLVYPV